MFSDKKISDIDEADIVERFKKTVGDKKRALLGIGDDAALLSVGNGDNVLLSTDCMVEEVHFFRRKSPLYATARKSVAGNVSDIAAMGGSVDYILLSLGLPGQMSIKELDELVNGVSDGCKEYDVELIGGNLVSSEKIFINITVVGSVKKGKEVSRSGGKCGDLVCVTGTLGDARAGLRILKGVDSVDEVCNNSERYLLKRHLYPVARLNEGRKIAEFATAMIDLSDGLMVDFGRICKASGVQGKIDKKKLPISSELLDRCNAWSLDPAEFVLSGGEDYELLFTVNPDDLSDLLNTGVHVSVIGKIVEVADESAEMISVNGFDHFKKGSCSD